MTPVEAIKMLKDIGTYPWGESRGDKQLEIANVIAHQSAALELIYLELKIGPGQPFYGVEKNFTPFSAYSRMKAASIAKDGFEGNSNDEIQCFIDVKEKA